MRVGVFGGTFDPIHLGHLRAAANARRELALERVLFVPSARPPHRSSPGSDAIDRYAMVALATAGEPSFVPCDVELRRTDTTYTVETLDALRAELPAVEWHLIVGADAFAEMATWREAARIFASCRVAVVPRPGAAAVVPVAPYSGALGVVSIAGNTLAISASEVRERLRRGEDTSSLLPPAVAEFIEKRGLYR